MKNRLPSNSKISVAWLAVIALGIAFLVYAFFRMALEVHQALPIHRLATMVSSPKWTPSLIELGVWMVIVLTGLILGLSAFVIACVPQKFNNLEARWVYLRTRFKRLRCLIIGLVLLLPAWLLLYTYWGGMFTGPYFRLIYLLSSSMILAALLPVQRDKIISPQALGMSMLFVSGVYAICLQLSTVVNFPFSITWSEGNRLFEYSIYFGKDLYQYTGKLEPIRAAVGRYMLWGMPFIIPGAPIWLHRLWNAFLSVGPHLALGFSLAYTSGFSRLGKIAFAMWIFLFLAQGPIYTPLILSALLVVWFVRPQRWLSSVLGSAAAGYYASLSRWTWLPAVPVWSAFFLLADYELPRSPDHHFWRWSNLRKLIWIAVVSLSGFLAGSLANPLLLQPKELSQGTSLSQPLLWYRLFPNATYPEGVLGALTMASLPLVLLLIWLAVTRNWPLNWVQMLAYAGASLIFLGGGIVVSVKIGGGNNLHNLDMFLVTLAILSGLAMRGRTLTGAVNWPGLVKALLVLAVLFPAWTAIRAGKPLGLPSQENVSKALNILNNQIAEAKKSGEVLFMDQRQLLTFGYIQEVPLVNEYEKKYVMDQAMAGNQAYFDQFYRDLAEQRFSLIITEPLFTRQKDSSYSFGEENNAWVHWVAEPLLCYYTPARKIQSLDIQLLVPRRDPQNCP